jgi:hypothetical protein
MAQYLLSVHSSVDGPPREPMTEAEMQKMGQQMSRLEDEMKSTGTWLFSARLHDPHTATVVRMEDGKLVTTDGPYVEAKEHIAGFYIIEAPDLDAALAWGSKVTACVGAPIEVRPFVGFEGPQV